MVQPPICLGSRLTHGAGKALFAFFAAMAETERENIRESTPEGLDTAARKGKHGGRPPVITDDMLHTVLRRRALAEHTRREAHPEAVVQAHTDFADLRAGELPGPRAQPQTVR
ncbi:recombinase family protein [Streptomyces sp. NBC_01716]|uniref:recombinase family protein n=1 Tax=Streptomyces sp. NBC_01716 TaxID=2975917 RepID=UPI003FCC6635